jgi:multidrug efflux pump subunit AcrA (membrane-fusion protein)
MRLSRRAAAVLTVGALLLVTSGVLSQPAGSKAGAAKGDKPAPTSVKVEKGPFHATINLKGVFAPAEMTEVVLRPEVWGSGLGGGFSVLTAVEPGTAVKKGDVLVTFHTDKIDRAIHEGEAELHSAEVALKLAEDELPVVEQSTPLDMAAAERAKRQADEDLKKFLDIDKPMAIEDARVNIKNAAHFLEYAREELKQLEKMYRSKDLTEETEEIILKRQRHQVEMAEYRVKVTGIHTEQSLKVDLPRREQMVRDNAVRATLALEKAKSALPLGLNQKRLALQKLRYDFERSSEKLKNLKKDRELMPVKAPADGVVYHGKCTKGQWNSAMVTPKLQRGSNLMPEEVFMTIVTTRPLLAEATVEEKDLHWLKPEAKGKATPAGFPDVRLPVTLTHLSSVPGTGGFPASFRVDASGAPEGVVPGMNCTIKVVAYRNDEALTLPASAVFSDDDEGHYVYQAGSGKKVEVKVGKTANDRIEILDGLSEGDAVLASKP